ncbi:hypothetical protein GALLR39Z86_03310 [Glycomyces algeriensis]|uniref:Uncharacterized protein n=1 Tax=Glycomyces algeriensis TaxID=256037 RepID=A0A9W6G4W0_9ACTN|nr:hypothetical protein GALLR39Z86_03310 [Glycomyces algeriensis]
MDVRVDKGGQHDPARSVEDPGCADCVTDGCGRPIIDARDIPDGRVRAGGAARRDGPGVHAPDWCAPTGIVAGRGSPGAIALGGYVRADPAGRRRPGFGAPDGCAGPAGPHAQALDGCVQTDAAWRGGPDDLSPKEDQVGRTAREARPGDGVEARHWRPIDSSMNSFVMMSAGVMPSGISSP